MSETQREHYDGESEIGSDPFHILNRDNRNHRKKQEIILDALQAESGDRILEVGCGDGLHAQRYAKQFHYTGVDISQSLVERTRQRVDDVTDQWTVRRCNALDLDWRDDEFASVVGTAILHHLSDQRRALREWIRVTKPGGSVTLMEPNYLFPKDLITAHLVEAERNKTKMAPWRLSDSLDSLGQDYRIETRIYTPPWPQRLFAVYDRLDDMVARVPLARWLSQMLLIHIEVE